MRAHDDGILNVGGVEAERPQLIQEFRRDPIEIRVEQNDPRRSRDGPSGFCLRPNVIEIVKDLRRRGIPSLAWSGSQFRSLARLQGNIPAYRLRPRPWLRLSAHLVERRIEDAPRLRARSLWRNGRSGRRHMTLRRF